jgi:aspartyl-tRNA(Asn)/glutamyl-tRNA(Gln) amidotransferase subunit C
MSQSEIESVRKTAALARLSLGEAEMAALGGQFARILDAFQSLTQLDVDGVEPMTGATELRDVAREDRPRPSLARDAVLANAPARAGEFFSVPKTIGGGDG